MSLKLESTTSTDTIKKLSIKPWIRIYIFNIHLAKYTYLGYIRHPHKSNLKYPKSKKETLVKDWTLHKRKYSYSQKDL